MSQQQAEDQVVKQNSSITIKVAKIDQPLKDQTPIQFQIFSVTPSDTLQQVYNNLLKLFQVPDSAETRLWASQQGTPYRQYSIDACAKPCSKVFTRRSGQEVILEIKQHQEESMDEDLSSPISSSSSSAWPLFSIASAKKQQSLLHSHLAHDSLQQKDALFSKQEGNKGHGVCIHAGVCGLQNLGNTCYMNSALQCVSSVPALKEYFLKEKYLQDLNNENPRAKFGAVARAYASLIKYMGSDSYTYVSPKAFKTIFGQVNPLFSDNAQHDSQEFLDFLLDGLHENLNRAKKKDSREEKHNEQQQQQEEKKAQEELAPEKSLINKNPLELARVAWKRERELRDSLVLDTFQGQLQSSLSCPEAECQASNPVSLNFDAFTQLSVPLPAATNRIDVNFYRYLNQVVASRYSVALQKQQSTARALRDGLAKLINEGVASNDKQEQINANHIVLASVQKNAFAYLPDTAIVNSNMVIYGFQVPTCTLETHLEYDFQTSYMGTKYLPFLTVRIKSVMKNPLGVETIYLYGKPFIIPFDVKTTTNKQLYDIVFNSIKRYFNFNEWPQINVNKPESFLASDLIHLKWDSYYTSTDEELSDPIVPYNDEISITGKEKDLRVNLSFFINDAIVKKCLDNKQFEAVDNHSSTRSGKKTSTVPLVECLKLFSSSEILAKDDKWKCPHCKKAVQATKKIDMWKLPEVLVVHLKRFDNNNEKIDSLVDFPVHDLDMTQFVPEEARNQPHLHYDLLAVINHYGTLFAGHYTAFAKNANGKWHKYDDSTTAHVEPSAVKTNAAYILFYKSKNAGKVTVKDYPVDPSVIVDFTAVPQQQEENKNDDAMNISE